MSRPKSSQTTVSDLKSHAGFWLRFVSNHVTEGFSRKLLQSGVTVAEWVMLREMHGRDDMTPSVLADLTGVTRGAASKLVDRLVGKKLVSRQERSDDRRYQNIALTVVGQRLVPTLAAIADRNDEEFFSPLSGGERETLVAILKKLVQAHGLRRVPTE